MEVDDPLIDRQSRKHQRYNSIILTSLLIANVLQLSVFLYLAISINNGISEFKILSTSLKDQVFNYLTTEVNYILSQGSNYTNHIMSQIDGYADDIGRCFKSFCSAS